MDEEKGLTAEESIEDLQLEGLKIIQKKKGFRFGVDAVLLSDFAKIRNKDRVMDFCTGTGILPLLIAGKTKAREIYGLEIQEEFSEMARRSIRMNGLEGRVTIVSGDLCDRDGLKGLGLFDVVTVNPPYKKNHAGIKNPEDALAIARHEVALSLEDVIASAQLVLKDSGRFYMVHRPERVIDILLLMRKYRIEPKRIRLVHPNLQKAPNIVLIEGQKYGGEFLKWEAPLFVYDLNGEYSDEIRRIYGDERR